MTSFWEKPLSELNSKEWEALCDQCGRCCLHKLQDEDTDQVYFTNVACHMLDIDQGSCHDYGRRQQHVQDCLQVSLDRPEQFQWLPTTCAYRLRYENKPLPAWHPLVTGDPKSAIQAKIAVAGRAISETPDLDLEEHIIHWIRCDE